jgi:beta-phosphoglucomutase
MTLRRRPGPDCNKESAGYKAEVRRWPQAVIFDMDGVIIDSHPAHRAAWREFLKNIGRTVPDRELDYILDGHKRKDILRYFLGDLSEDKLAAFGKQKDDIFQRAAPDVRPIPGIIDFLVHLKHREIVVAVATSASQIRTLSTIERLGLSGYFRVITTANDVPQGKPHPEVYAATCRCLKTAPSNALVFEDAVSGIQAARSAGLRCVGLADHESAKELRAAGAECVIQNFVGFSLDSLRQPQSEDSHSA